MTTTAGPTRAVPSPCNNVCRIDAASGCCEGCLRTLDEIAAWTTLDDAAKRRIWIQLALRREARMPATSTGIRLRP